MQINALHSLLCVPVYTVQSKQDTRACLQLIRGRTCIHTLIGLIINGHRESDIDMVQRLSKINSHSSMSEDKFNAFSLICVYQEPQYLCNRTLDSCEREQMPFVGPISFCNESHSYLLSFQPLLGGGGVSLIRRIIARQIIIKSSRKGHEIEKRCPL